MARGDYPPGQCFTDSRQQRQFGPIRSVQIDLELYSLGDRPIDVQQPAPMTAALQPPNRHSQQTNDNDNRHGGLI
jgi:hypothetical protein